MFDEIAHRQLKASISLKSLLFTVNYNLVQSNNEYYVFDFFVFKILMAGKTSSRYPLWVCWHTAVKGFSTQRPLAIKSGH